MPDAATKCPFYLSLHKISFYSLLLIPLIIELLDHIFDISEDEISIHDRISRERFMNKYHYASHTIEPVS